MQLLTLVLCVLIEVRHSVDFETLVSCDDVLIEVRHSVDFEIDNSIHNSTICTIIL